MNTIQLIENLSANSQKKIIDISETYNPSSKLYSQEVSETSIEKFHQRKLYTDGLIIIDNLTALKEKVTYNFTFNDSILVMKFHNQGKNTVLTQKKKKENYKEILEKTHNIHVISPKELNITFDATNEVDSFFIILSKAFYLKLIPNQNEINSHLIQCLENNTSTYFSEKALPLNQDMKRIIDNIRSCTRTGSLQRLCLEIKITELLLLQFEQYELLKTRQKTTNTIAPFDQKKIEEAKLYLEKNFHTPITIKKLSLIVGINESKLKAYFKKSYNQTIHSFVIKLRMEKAYQLITEQNLLMKEVSLKIGYQNPSHFSAAFKEFYGFAPSVATSIQL